MGLKAHLFLAALLASCSDSKDNQHSATDGLSTGGPPSSAQGASSSGSEPTSGTSTVPTGPTTGTPTGTTGPTTGIAAPSTGDSVTTEEITTGTTGGNEGYPCDFYQQDCNPGLKCAPLDAPICLSDQFQCVPLANPTIINGGLCTLSNGVCGGFDDCDIGLFCSFPDEKQLFGTCLPICMGSIGEGFTCALPTEECIRIGGDVSVCIPRCHPLNGACGVGQICSYQGFQFGMACIAQDPMPSGLLMPCASAKDCEAGLSCASDGVPGCDGPCCTPFCMVQDVDSCSSVPNSGCVALEFSEPSPDVENLGICR